MALFLYRILFVPAFILLLPYYLWRMWRRGGYAAGMANRFGWMRGLPPKPTNHSRIWIQAVSVGELNAIGPLLRELAQESGIEVILTTTTSTGLRLARSSYGQQVSWIGTFPIDFCWISWLAWRQIRPDVVLLMEGELWPEHIHQGWRRSVPVAVINGRLSERSYSRQLKLRTFGRAFFKKIRLIVAGSELDRKRFSELGWLQPGQIVNAGNLKFDFEAPPTMTQADYLAEIQDLGFASNAEEAEEVQVLMGSSTWPGEEACLMKAFLELQTDHPGLRLLIVPRHAERRREIEVVLKDCRLPIHFRSDEKTSPPGTRIYIADTTGELKALTRLATVVFIGKSLPPNTGGQTPMEAAALGKPLLMGPDMSNFSTVTRQLLQADAAQQIYEASALLPAVRQLLGDRDLQHRMGKRAAALVAAGRGATQRTLEQIRCLLPPDQRC
jgi:3-deoxy-D-manno-octulosonic-acid transferase